MVAARNLEPQKQLIEVVLFHKFEGAYPDVPIAPGVDFEGLVQPDRDAGEDPFFITLLLGHRDQISRNGRRYVGDVAPKAIYDAIQNRRITGQLGHTAEERRGWEFKIPVLHWVGALIDKDGNVWGKAYVPRTAMELREYYRIQIKKNASAGTSLEGMGYQEYNDELEMWDIIELDVHRIDAVAPEGVGILKAANMPKVTKETQNPIQEAAPDEVAVGDLVAWDNRNNQLMRGRVNTIWTEGEVEVPYSDSPAIVASAEMPLARMDVYEPHYKTGEWRLTGWQEIQYVRDLTKIVALPELHTEDNPLSEGQSEDDELSNHPTIEGDILMGEKKEVTPNDEQTEIVGLKEQHKAETRKLSLKISELESSLRNYNTIVEMLAVDGQQPDDPILALQGMFKKVESLELENFDLLDAAIKQEVAEHVKVELIRPVVEGKVKDLKPARKTDVKRIVADVLARPEIKTLLQYTVQQEMGPNVTTPTSNPADKDEQRRSSAVIPS